MSNVEDEDRWSWANEENKPLDEKYNCGNPVGIIIPTFRPKQKTVNRIHGESFFGASG